MTNFRKLIPGLAAVLALATPAFACPNCNAALGGSLELNAWFWSIVAMAFSPFIIGGGIAAWIWRMSRSQSADV